VQDAEFFQQFSRRNLGMGNLLPLLPQNFVELFELLLIHDMTKIK
jgi:hypothetical protein